MAISAAPPEAATPLTTSTDTATERPVDDVPARPRLALEAILGSKAVISVNGRREMLAVGEGKAAGPRLLALEGERATVLFNGRRYRLRLGQHPIATQFVKPQHQVVVIAPDQVGMYTTPGSINGRPVQFLVDTGATTVAMNAGQARRLGVDFRLRGKPVLVGTASGSSKAYFVNLEKVSVGGISARNVGAVVLEGTYPVQILLGMSFLSQVHMQRNGVLLELSQKQ